MKRCVFFSRKEKDRRENIVKMDLHGCGRVYSGIESYKLKGSAGESMMENLSML